MPTLLQISDVIALRHPKILFISNENNVTAYFFKNSENLDTKTIRERVKTNAFKFNDNAIFIIMGQLTISKNNWLDHVYVTKYYQKMGIGTQLVKFAIDNLDLKYIGCVKENQAYDCCLTEEGEQLIINCIKKGIVKKSMCIFENDTNLLSNISDQDPGQISFAIAQALSKQHLPPLKRKRDPGPDIRYLKLCDPIKMGLPSQLYSPIRPFLTKVPEKKFADEKLTTLSDEFMAELSVNDENRHPNKQ